MNGPRGVVQPEQVKFGNNRTMIKTNYWSEYKVYGWNYKYNQFLMWNYHASLFSDLKVYP